MSHSFEYEIDSKTKLVVEFDYSPEEEMTRDYPGYRESVEITNVEIWIKQPLNTLLGGRWVKTEISLPSEILDEGFLEDLALAQIHAGFESAAAEHDEYLENQRKERNDDAI